MADEQLYSLQEFSPQELATLQRLDGQPHARPECRVIDLRPLTPTGPILRAYELVPQPDEETGTAAVWSTHYLAEACAAEKLAHHLMPRNAGPDDDWTDYLAALGDFVHLFSIGFLMRHVSDETARELANSLYAGDVADEWMYQWLRETGVDPGRIRSAMTTDEIREARQRRRAELRARTEVVHTAAAEQLAAAGLDVEMVTDNPAGAR